MEFEWNATKAKTNLRKHRVSFEEAASVFSEIRVQRIMKIQIIQRLRVDTC